MADKLHTILDLLVLGTAVIAGWAGASGIAISGIAVYLLGQVDTKSLKG